MPKQYLPDGTIRDIPEAELKALMEAHRPKPAEPPVPKFPVAPRPTAYKVSKDSLIRALVAMGKYDAFVAVREQTPAFAKELWAIEPHFKTTDPLIQQFLPAVKAAIALTDTELSNLLWSCRVV